MKNKIGLDRVGETLLLMGNEAIARGALEAGVSFCSSYPGNPSSEIMETLASVARDLNIYAEWSVNEKVALEAATAASFAGLRAMVSMKQNGINVVSDFLVNLSLSGIKGGIVLVTCDDPGGISSTNEEDARFIAQVADIPLLEPAHPQDALDMTRWAFDLSETIGSVCVLRSISRISHTRGSVTLGSLSRKKRTAHFDTSISLHAFPVTEKHKILHQKLAKARELFETSSFNSYEGPPDDIDLLIIACGTGFLYAREALELLDLTGRVGLLKIGTTWPLPEEWLENHLSRCERILFVEDVDPFLERNIKAFFAQISPKLGVRTFYGKGSGHIPPFGELNPDILVYALARILDIDYKPEDRDYVNKAEALVSELVPPREFGFCPGCPHRASFWSIKNALKWDDRDGFVSGDIGCYTMGIWPTGFNQVKSVHAMGSGVGMASGYGKLYTYGFNQPVISVVGDSTFFHAGLPPLINAIYNQANFLLIILDNGATAMTGFQPHPGTGVNAIGDRVQSLDIASICRALGVSVEVADPYEIKDTANTIYRLLQERTGVRVLIMKRKCALVQKREEGFPYRVRVDEERCVGDSCGCNRFCTRVFRCPGLIWDQEKKKTRIDEVICVGCGVCTEICPEGAIVREKDNHE
nr:indolepyruvate ferredoxin oxidoreductase subunit alpha [Desulfobacterales bacterium]